MAMELTVVSLSKHPNGAYDANYCVIEEIKKVAVTDYLYDVISEFYTKLEVFEKYDDEYEKVEIDEIEKAAIFSKIIEKVFLLQAGLFNEYENTQGRKSKDIIFLKLKNLSNLKDILINYLCILQQKNEADIRLLVL